MTIKIIQEMPIEQTEEVLILQKELEGTLPKGVTIEYKEK